MNKEKLEKLKKFYTLDYILSINFDILIENTLLKNIINFNNEDIHNKEIKYNSKIINYSIENKTIECYSIDKIFNYHKNSKCIILKNTLNDEIIIFSITKYNNDFFKNMLLNKNRLRFLPKDLSFIEKKECKIFEGVYQELFKNNFLKNIKNYILNISNSININLVGKSINGMTNIVFGYLISLLIKNKINIYSFSICKFCNQEFINEIEKKKNIDINIINHKYDALQLIIKPFSMNFKNIILINDDIIVQNNNNETQDNIIYNNFISNILNYSIKYHLSIHFFEYLIKIK